MKTQDPVSNGISGPRNNYAQRTFPLLTGVSNFALISMVSVSQEWISFFQDFKISKTFLAYSVVHTIVIPGI